jgi:hypothetical protein
MGIERHCSAGENARSHALDKGFERAREIRIVE